MTEPDGAKVMPMNAAVPDQPQRSPLFWGAMFIVMICAGMAIPAQGRVNAELAEAVDDAYLAAFLSFFVGLAVMTVLVLSAPPGRAAMRRVRPVLRSGEVKWWYLLAGGVGGYFVLTQTLTIGMIGVAVFTVAVVTGQTLGGLLWDRIGLGPGGRKRITRPRLLGAMLTVFAVLWAVSPQLTVADRGPAWLLLVILPFSGGFLQAAQQALNGRQTAAYGSTLPATFFNFAAGSAVLLATWLIASVAQGGSPGLQLSATWWHYLGGPLGVMFIMLGALLVTKVGVLLAAMGMIAGQLIGSLVLDLVVPAPGSLVTLATVLGTGLTLVAVLVASLPDMKRSGR